MKGSASDKLAYKRNIASYLLELKALTNMVVRADDLSPIDTVSELRLEAARLADCPVSRFKIGFEEKSSSRFKDYVRQLTNTNRSPVFIWTKKTSTCGLFSVKSLEVIDFSFSFEISADGVIVFLAADLRDKLLLDFSEDDQGKRVLEVETQGIHWPSVAY